MKLDSHGLRTVAVAILLALIALFMSYDHIAIPRTQPTLYPLHQPGIPFLAAAVRAALGEAQLFTIAELKLQRYEPQQQATAREQRLKRLQNEID